VRDAKGPTDPWSVGPSIVVLRQTIVVTGRVT